MFFSGVLVNLLILGKLVSGVPALFDEELGVQYPVHATTTSKLLTREIHAKSRPSSDESVSHSTQVSNGFPEEQGKYFEGDIRRPSSFFRNGLRAESSRWKKGIVPYDIAPTMGQAGREMIRKAIEEFHRHTCIRFILKRASDVDYVYFNSSNTGCWSYIGRLGRGNQTINLQSPGCTSVVGTAIHEMMHAIGFEHEHNRADRDNYVTIDFKNIKKGQERNFNKTNKDTFDLQGIRYDYSSVMHYSEGAFSNNGSPTIVPKKRGVTLGQREGLSERDKKKVQKMYKCKMGSGQRRPSSFQIKSRKSKNKKAGK